MTAGSAWAFLVGNFARDDKELALFNEALREIQAEQRIKDAVKVASAGREREKSHDHKCASALYTVARQILEDGDVE